MRYYKQFDNNNNLLVIGIGLGGMEITEVEYNNLLVEIREKAELTDKLYNGKIAIENIPIEWQEEIQYRIDERKKNETTLTITTE